MAKREKATVGERMVCRFLGIKSLVLLRMTKGWSEYRKLAAAIDRALERAWDKGFSDGASTNRGQIVTTNPYRKARK